MMRIWVCGAIAMVVNIKIGITGLPGAGKTHALIRIIEMLREEDPDVSVGGMIDEPVMEGKHRVGFTVRNIVTGETEVFAHTDYESKIMVGKIGMDVSRFDSVAVDAIKTAMESCDIIVIDEIGKLEVESEAFVEAVRAALEAEKPMILTLHKKSRNPLLQDVRRRDDVRILEITPTNRNILPFKIVSLMTGENI